MTKKFAIVLALFVIAVVCCAGCIGPGEEPVDPVDPVVPVDPVDPVTPVDPVVPVEEYSVMFMLNYGDAGAYTAETVKAGETVSKPATPTRSGYTFKGWFTAAEGGAEYDFTQAVNADVMLYAQWKKVSSSSSSSSSSGSTDSNAHLEGTTVTPSIGNAVTGEGGTTSVTGTVSETGGNKVVTVTDSSSGVEMKVTYDSGATVNGNTVTGTVSSVAVTYPEKSAGTASADSPAAYASLALELIDAVDTLPTIDSDFKQDVSSKITDAFSGDKPLAMITASNTEKVNSGDTIPDGGLTITFKLTGLSDDDRSKLVGYHVSGNNVETVQPDSVNTEGSTTTVVLKGDSFSSWAVGIAKCLHTDLTLTHDDGTTFGEATHSGNCKDCDYTVANEKCVFTETPQDDGSTLYTCSKCGYQYSKAGSEMNLESVTLDDGKITSAAQLFKLAGLVNAGQFTGDVTLEVDIDLAGLEWTPIGTADKAFSGTFDGKGHNIKNLKVAGNVEGVGFFGSVEGEATNLETDIGTVYDTERKQFISPEASYTTRIGNFNLVNVDVSGSDSHIGAAVGTATYAYIYDITVESGKIYSTVDDDADSLGGVVGRGYSSFIDDCTNAASIEGKGYNIGGIVGAMRHSDSRVSIISDCINNGDITYLLTDGGAGGICGQTSGAPGLVIYNSVNNGEISASANGKASDTHINGDSTKGVNYGSRVVSGILGLDSAGGGTPIIIAECENAGNIYTSGGNELASLNGIVGYVNNAQIINCKVTGEISGNALEVGGITAYVTSSGGSLTISNPSVTGTVSNSFSGGLTGQYVASAPIGSGDLGLHLGDKGKLTISDLTVRNWGELSKLLPYEGWVQFENIQVTEQDSSIDFSGKKKVMVIFDDITSPQISIDASKFEDGGQYLINADEATVTITGTTKKSASLWFLGDDISVSNNADMPAVTISVKGEGASVTINKNASKISLSGSNNANVKISKDVTISGSLSIGSSNDAVIHNYGQIQSSTHALIIGNSDGVLVHNHGVFQDGGANQFVVYVSSDSSYTLLNYNGASLKSQDSWAYYCYYNGITVTQTIYSFADGLFRGGAVSSNDFFDSYKRIYNATKIHKLDVEYSGTGDFDKSKVKVYANFTVENGYKQVELDNDWLVFDESEETVKVSFLGKFDTEIQVTTEEEEQSE